MIKVVKSSTTPASLLSTQAYDGEDVKSQLIDDHKGKCYLCERTLITDYQIEHLDSTADRQDWNNLFLACSYCNLKKSNNYDDIVLPTSNIEEDILQMIEGGKAIFQVVNEGIGIDKTIKLLNSIHNGCGIARNKKEERFFEFVQSQVSNFSSVVKKYIFTKSVENRDAVIEELSINKEFLGFKYWIICSNVELKTEFADYIIWNKHE